MRPPRMTRAVLALVFLLAVSALFSIRIAGKMRDFEVYWTAAARARAAEPLYRAEDGHFQFKYLPAFAVFASPVSFLPLRTAKAFWYSTSIALLIALVVFSLKALPERRRPAWFLVTVVIVAMGKFYGHELVLGQVNLLFGVLVVGAILALRHGRPAAAAALCVAAMVVKPYAVLFLPWVVLAGGWRAAVSAAAGVAAVGLAPVALYGAGGTIDLHAAWWRTVTESTAPNLTNPDNVSVAALAAKWLGVGSTASVVAAVLSLALLVAAAIVVRRGRHVRRPEALDGALLLTLVPLLSPQGWDYVFLVSTPAIALVANYARDIPRPQRWLTWAAVLTIGLSLFDVLGRQNYARFMAWSVITLCFFVVIAALATLRFRRTA